MSAAFQVTQTPFDSGRTPQRKRLRAVFLNGAHQDLYLDELRLVIRHPLFILFCLTVVATNILLRLGFMREWPLPGLGELRVLVALKLAAVLGGAATSVAVTYLIARMARGQEVVRIFLSVPLWAGVAMTEIVLAPWFLAAFGVPLPSWGQRILHGLPHFLLAEALVLLLLRPLGRHMVAGVRLYSKGEASGPAGPDDTPCPVTASVLRAQAQGNYVQLWTETGQVLKPGPFHAVVGGFPDTLGCLVHRSEWVATRAVVSATRDGRATLLLLVTGDTVRVAATRTGKVQDWLAQFAPDRPRRRGYSIGGGETKRQSRPGPEITTSAIGGTAPSAPRESVTPTKS